MGRQSDLDSLYELLRNVKEEIGGFRKLSDSDLGPSHFPDSGIYFFFAKDETRSTEAFPRVTRIGTSGRGLWERLREHRGSTRGKYACGGNHRESSFRKEVGGAIINRDELQDEYSEWYEGSSSPPELRETEQPIEERVSSYIRELPFVWVAVDDRQHREFLEQNITALVSNFGKPSIDSRSDDWLGYQNPNEEIRRSELWCINHVAKSYDPEVVDVFEDYITANAP